MKNMNVMFVCVNDVCIHGLYEESEYREHVQKKLGSHSKCNKKSLVKVFNIVICINPIISLGIEEFTKRDCVKRNRIETESRSGQLPHLERR